MKPIHIRLFLLVAFISLLVHLSSCKGDDPVTETEEEIFLRKIEGNWKSSVAVLDGKDVSKSFPGLAIMINENKAITVTNPVAPIWKAASTFVLEQSGTTYNLKRNDGLLISVPEVTSGKIVLIFQYDQQ
jgi:hypothetical protein